MEFFLLRVPAPWIGIRKKYNLNLKYVTWVILLFACLHPFFHSCMRHFEIGVTTRHYFRCYVHLVEIHPVYDQPFVCHTDNKILFF